jgi:hypothetical protein
MVWMERAKCNKRIRQSESVKVLFSYESLFPIHLGITINLKSTRNYEKGDRRQPLLDITFIFLPVVWPHIRCKTRADQNYKSFHFRSLNMYCEYFLLSYAKSHLKYIILENKSPFLWVSIKNGSTLIEKFNFG